MCCQIYAFSLANVNLIAKNERDPSLLVGISDGKGDEISFDSTWQSKSTIPENLTS